jgi:hypothetical protein
MRLDDAMTITERFMRVLGELRTAVDSTGDAAAEQAANGYEQPLREMRAAMLASDPLKAFEDEWKQRRLRELEAEYRAPDPHPLPRLTAAELDDYRAPDGYAIALDKLRKH